MRFFFFATKINLGVLLVTTKLLLFVGARGPRMKLKSCSIGVGLPQAKGSRRKVTRGEEGMSHRTLSRSRLKEGYEERESMIIGEVSSLE